MLQEIRSVLQKEWLSESRSLSGITTMAQLCFVSLVLVNNVTWFASVSPLLAAGLYWLIIVFVSSISLTRIFLQEEEMKTADLWRLYARPEAVFYAKAIFNCLQVLVASIFLTIGMIVMLRLNLRMPGVLLANVIFGAIAIGVTVTLAGALACRANNRYAVAAAISVPLLVAILNVGVTGTATAWGEGLKGGQNGPIAMLGYAVAATALGPVVYSKIWRS